MNRDPTWPALERAAWQDTYTTLHMYTQIIGKVRLRQSAPLNHWWHVPLYVSARGLTTSPIPYRDRTFQIDLDLIDHNVVVRTSEGATRGLALVRRPVAGFYRELMAILDALDLHVPIWPHPVEIPDPVPFDRDARDAYDAAGARRFWEVLRRVDTVFKRFAGGFVGKSSPVVFWWGSFDLAISRFSGRRAPPRPGADRITQEAYSHEVSSLGFWPGSGPIAEAAFYSYTVPEPPGFAATGVPPAGAFYSGELHEYVLPYEDVRRSPEPAETLLAFARAAYEAGAGLGRWDRAALERGPLA